VLNGAKGLPHTRQRAGLEKLVILARLQRQLLFLGLGLLGLGVVVKVRTVLCKKFLPQRVHSLLVRVRAWRLEDGHSVEHGIDLLLADQPFSLRVDILDYVRMGHGRETQLLNDFALDLFKLIDFTHLVIYNSQMSYKCEVDSRGVKKNCDTVLSVVVVKNAKNAKKRKKKFSLYF